MNNQRSSYRNIFKATAIYGGVQIFTILVGILKSKFAAVFLGADGIGLVGIFTSTIDMIRGFTGLGINTSAVREISEATGEQKEQKSVARTVVNATRWYWFTAIGGFITVAGLSPWLSLWMFGNYQYGWSFAALSLMIFFMTITAGQLAVMQGMRKVIFIAKASLYGNLTGLVFLVPLYYYLGTVGIVPFLVINSAIAFCYSLYFRRKIEIERTEIAIKESFKEGLSMAKLGFILTLSTTIALTVGYIIRLYIKDTGSLEQVGYFTAVFAISEGYLGVVFSAVVSDFFPRLSAINKDNEAMQQAINQQGEMLGLIVSPLLIIMIIAAPLILELLYSTQFSQVASLLQWYMMGMFIKAASVPIAFTMLAKGDTTTYMIKDFVSQAVMITTALIGYKYWGLTGIGIAYVVAHSANFIILTGINYFKYNIKLRRSYYKFALPQLSCLLACFIVIVTAKTTWVAHSVGALTLTCSMLVSFIGLNSLIDLKSILNKLKTKFLKK